jgi:hypothetical protein
MAYLKKQKKEGSYVENAHQKHHDGRSRAITVKPFLWPGRVLYRKPF